MTTTDTQYSFLDQDVYYYRDNADSWDLDVWATNYAGLESDPSGYLKVSTVLPGPPPPTNLDIVFDTNSSFTEPARSFSGGNSIDRISWNAPETDPRFVGTLRYEYTIRSDIAVQKPFGRGFNERHLGIGSRTTSTSVNLSPGNNNFWNNIGGQRPNITLQVRAFYDLTSIGEFATHTEQGPA